MGEKILDRWNIIIMGIPAILGGCLVAFKEAFEGTVTIQPVPMVVGFIVSAVVGYLSIKMINWLMKSNKFGIFAYYTAAVGILTLILGFVK